MKIRIEWLHPNRDLCGSVIVVTDKQLPDVRSWSRYILNCVNALLIMDENDIEHVFMNEFVKVCKFTVYEVAA